MSMKTMNDPSSPLRPVFTSRVVPVIVITKPAQAVPLAEALLEGGIDVMEITLRHAAGLAAIEAVAKSVPAMQVGAGTVTVAQDVARVQNAGARFALSPGMTEALVAEVLRCQLPFVPGTMTPGEIMRAREHGFRLVKLFPAAQAGGLGMLKALGGPLADMQFCPTGGISLANLQDYLRLDNVPMVGGSWLTPLDLVEAGNWAAITRLAREATDLARAA
ncbi:MAG: bifunctional 4-hydroxy-2-oxoglutarate aldolase/2-dehydro-3-deoxy-phosphogluconate aldolase [Hylemonella sp.]|nr:bifunctional 4-hydroxy-2-oxoglutarate aldolase/2-dehydro-3-deoxy-phosphogluconate aldolase [Hylemonella sp.]